MAPPSRLSAQVTRQPHEIRSLKDRFVALNWHGKKSLEKTPRGQLQLAAVGQNSASFGLQKLMEVAESSTAATSHRRQSVSKSLTLPSGCIGLSRARSRCCCGGSCRELPEKLVWRIDRIVLFSRMSGKNVDCTELGIGLRLDVSMWPHQKHTTPFKQLNVIVDAISLGLKIFCMFKKSDSS